VGIFDRLFRPDIGKLKEKKDVDGLIKALRDKDSDIRLEVAYALGEIKDKRAVEPLIQALKDEDNFVREAAVEALEKIEAKES